MRSSLPKRLWNKCMEYKVIENGVPVWYKLTGDKLLPLKGRCAKDKPLYYEGMLVVPNNMTAKQTPKIEGMIVYQKDNNKLYVQGDGKLNALADEKIINKLSKDIAELKSKFDQFNQTLRKNILATQSKKYIAKEEVMQ